MKIFYLFQFLLCGIYLTSCSKMIDSTPKTKPIILRYSLDETGLKADKRNETFGPGKMEISLNVVFVTDGQNHVFSDKDSIISGKFEIYQPTCKKKIVVNIPEGYFVNEMPSPIKTINPCGVNKIVDFSVDMSEIRIHQSKALRNKSYHFLNAYPTISETKHVATQLQLRIHPVPSLFY